MKHISFRTNEGLEVEAFLESVTLLRNIITKRWHVRCHGQSVGEINSLEKDYLSRLMKEDANERNN